MPDPATPFARHILTYAQGLRGGVEAAQMRLIRGWLSAGRRVTLVLEEAPAEGAVPAGAETMLLGSASYRALFALPGIVTAVRPDVIFCAGNHYTSVAAVTKLRLGSACPPIVGKMSNAPERSDHGRVMAAAHRAWLRAHGRFLDHLVAMTPATADAAAAAVRMEERTSVIPNPPVTATSAADVALPAGRFILGVGRLAAQKRWDRLVAALPHLADGRVPLVILGEGEERAALEAQALRLGVADRVHLSGRTAAPLAAMARGSVLALTSDYEGVPGVLREALSVGTPVVATESSRAIAEIVTSPALGTIVPRDDAGALVAALDHWLAPGAVRPGPVPQPGSDSAPRYLALFDGLVARRHVMTGG